MHGDELRALVLRAPGEFRRIDGRLVPAKPHLHRDRNGHRRDHGADERHGMVEVPHQRRSRQAAGDLLGGAPHVDIHEIGAVRLDKARRLGQIVGAAAGKLHRPRRHVGAVGLRSRLDVAGKQTVAGHHLRKDEASAQSMGNAAKREVADAGHRRKQHPVRNRQAIYPEGRGGRGVRHAYSLRKIMRCL